MAKIFVLAAAALFSVAASERFYEEEVTETIYVTDNLPLGTHHHACCEEATIVYVDDYPRRTPAPECNSYSIEYENDNGGRPDEAAATAPPRPYRPQHHRAHGGVPRIIPGPAAAAEASRAFTDALMDPGCKVAGPGFSALMLSLIEANHGNMPVVSV
ncbi:hypothetical protein IWQ57_001771 [Coemansia nantahalensis]|uniref:Uncharacterized protein n=1 Tax=Coemansia nantahalensis TaxID=2789366 RepID=A0ACC1K3R4_9FUNG|nr:hypothetical protein IWQ57_001771 [Coemansia nantahalensis]